jgi:membrane-associated protease RseP (regulator of RpoE activity)
MTVIAKEPRAGTPAAAETPHEDFTPESGNFNQVVRLLVVLALVTVLFLLAGLGDLLLFIAILVAVVMLHELGHFATAKWAGMKVTEYFVGFGPRLWSVRRGETEYGVKAIPAGGYVRITGFTVLEEVPDEDEPRAYRQQSFGKRMIVGSAGSAMHFIIAFVLAVIAVFAFGAPTNNLQVAGLEHPQGVVQTPAQHAGLAAGDVIVSVNGKALKNPNTLSQTVARSAGVPVTLGVRHDGQTREVTVTPADARGVKVGGTTLAPAGASSPHGYIGVQLAQATQSVNPIRAVGMGANNLWQLTTAEVAGIGHLFSASGLSSVFHQVSNSKDATQVANNPAGAARPISIIGIARLGPQAQQDGIYFLLEFLIVINIVFGLLNMLPMIPFDGGHVAVAGYEWIRTKKGQPYYKADITKLFPVVFAVMAFLAIFVLSSVYLDITHPIKNLFP